MTSPFEKLTIEDIRAYLEIPAEVIKEAAVNRAFYEGDHWQNGESWGGPLPDNNGEGGVEEAMEEIRRGFVSQNVILEVTNRLIRAVLGSAPSWSVGLVRSLGPDEEPTPAEQALIAEADAALSTRWDSGNWHAIMLKAAVTLALSGRSCLRLYVPAGLTTMDSDGTRRIIASSLDEAFKLLFLQHPSIEQATVAVDEDTQQPIGCYSYSRGDVELFEICYGDGDDTILGQTSVQDQEQISLYHLPGTGGRLLLYQMNNPPFITEQVRSLQKMLNEALTRQRRNDHVNALGEVTYIGLEPPISGWSTDPETGKMIPQIEAMDVGPGARNFLTPSAVKDADGKLVLDENGRPTFVPGASIHVREPTDPRVLISSQIAAYQGILKETHQLHAAIIGDATTSGESRAQARADFIASLADLIVQIEAAGRWLLETSLALASLFAGQPGRFSGLRVSFKCRVNAGPLTSTEREAIIKEVAAGLESVEGAMMRLGRDDPAITLAQIEADLERAAVRQQANLGSALLSFDRS